jgi:hypothetical protein
MNLLSVPNCSQTFLGIYSPPLWPPTHFTFVRKKLEEPELPFLPSTTRGTFLDQMRVEVTTERGINPEDKVPHFLHLYKAVHSNTFSVQPEAGEDSRSLGWDRKNSLP